MELMPNQTLKEDTNYHLRKQIAIFTGIFVITALGTYITFALFGQTLLRYIDGLYQNYPLLVKTKSIFADFFQGNGFDFWTWELGLGGDSIAAYESRLFNPLMLLAASFPVKFLGLGYSFAVIVGEYISGICFLLFSKKLGHTRIQSLIGAFCYSFSGWVIYSSSHQLSFLTATIILPLLLLGVEKILKKESPIFFIVLVGLSLVLSFYWSYMSAIIVILYFLLRYFFYLKSFKWKVFFSELGKFVVYGIAGILLSAPILIPRLILITNATTGASSPLELVYSLKTYLDFIPGFFTGDKITGSYSFASVSALCILMIPMIFKRAKKKNTAAMLFVLCIIMALIPFFGSMFNGFSYATGRWMFILAFFFVLSAIECYTPEVTNNKKNLLLLGSIFTALSLWSLFINIMESRALDFQGCLQCIITILTGGVLLVSLCLTRGKERKKNRAILVILILSTILTYNAEFALPNITGNNEFVGLTKAYEAYEHSPQRVMSEIQDDSFFRIDQMNGVREKTTAGSMANEGIYFGNKPINIYQSTLHGKWTEFNKIMANSCGNFYRTTMYSNDNRPGLNLLMGVKYFLGENNGDLQNTLQYGGYGFEPYKEIDGVQVLKNKYCLGLGATYDMYIKESEFMNIPVVDREMALLQAAVVPDQYADTLGDLKEIKASDVGTTAKVSEYTTSKVKNVKLKGNKIVGGTAKGSVQINIEPKKNRHVWVMAKGVNPTTSKDKFKLNASTVGIDKIAIDAVNSSFGLSGVEDYILNLGYFENGANTINLTFNRAFACEQIYIYSVPMKLYDEKAKELVKKRFLIDQFENDDIKGHVTTVNGGITYFSIPNSGGWDIYVDGRKAEKIKDVNIGFTGVYIPPGEHEVELNYSCKGLSYGIAIFLLGIIMCIIIGIRSRRQKLH